ncbi:MAG TPA: homoserine O-acetyltransferase [Candidatus Methanoperedens sp.]|nr:homoserine O-acetyltransferase [Candidatus Methanoperedens sp.]
MSTKRRTPAAIDPSAPRAGEAVAPAYPPDSVGLVATRIVTFGADRPLRLESGAQLSPVTVAYETYGELNAARDNVVLVCHALSGSAHAAGYHGTGAGEKPGWWELMIGPGKAIDTTRWFVVCGNFLGSCYGTTGPTSIDPATGRPWGIRFPAFTIRDMVELQRLLLDELGIERILAVVGGSMGGMQALQWAISDPGRVAGVIPVATAGGMSAQGIAFNEVGRRAIMGDPRWRGGDYAEGDPPAHGLALARMVGHITYLSEEAMHRKFGRRRLAEEPETSFGREFAVEDYLRAQGDSFVRRFDANTYLYLTRAMDSFDLVADHGSLQNAFAASRASFLVVSFRSDWLFPPAQSQAIVQALKRSGHDVAYANLESDQGHDAFLLPGNRLGDLLSGFLARLHERARP